MAGEALSLQEVGIDVGPVQKKLSPGPGRLRKEVVAHQSSRIHRALIDAVAERGYESLRVRDIVRRAGVSTRAFYELFSSKDDCFLYSYDRLTRRATRRMVAVQAGEPDWRRRARLIFDELARQIAQDPKGARLVLVDIYRASPACAERARHAQRAFEVVLGESLARSPRGVAIPRLMIEGIVAGVAGVARDCLVSGRPIALREMGDELVGWALRFADSTAAELATLDGGSVWRDTLLESSRTTRTRAGSPRDGFDGDHALILKHTADLAVKDGYSALTVERIRTEANVSRREFGALFGGVEACYAAAVEQRAEEAMARASRAQAAARTWSGGIYRAIAAYWAQMDSDSFLAQAFLGGDCPAAGVRSRKRMLKAIADHLLDSVPYDKRPTALEAEASLHAAWALFQRHLSPSGSSQRNLSATLAYMLLVPAIGSRAALSEIASEQ